MQMSGKADGVGYGKNHGRLMGRGRGMGRVNGCVGEFGHARVLFLKNGCRFKVTPNCMQRLSAVN